MKRAIVRKCFRCNRMVPVRVDHIRRQAFFIVHSDGLKECSGSNHSVDLGKTTRRVMVKGEEDEA